VGVKGTDIALNAISKLLFFLLKCFVRWNAGTVTVIIPPSIIACYAVSTPTTNTALIDEHMETSLLGLLIPDKPFILTL
jgi:hypothetical protein